MRQSYSANVERNVTWHGDFESEPYEAPWASEAIFFVRSLEGSAEGDHARIQISPDGMHWVDEGTDLQLPALGATTFARVAHFGNWLRIVGHASSEIKVIVTIQVKE